MSLDRSRPAGDIFGAYFGARYYQDCHYFDAAGQYLFSNPGTASPPGCPVRVKLDSEGNPVGDPESTPEGSPAPRPAAAAAAPAPAVPAAPAAPAPAAPAPAADAPAVPADLTREQRLMQMPAAQLIALVKAAGGEAISGAGSKRRAVDWLLANTQD